MAAPGKDKNLIDPISAAPAAEPQATSSFLQPQATLLKPAAGQTATDAPIDDLHAAIKEMIDLFDMANELARRGEQVNIDLLAMQVAVLCDAICDADPVIGRPFRGDLEALLGHLNMLENTLMRERVQLALSVEAADRRQRAKAAYGRVLPSMTTPDAPKRPDDQSNE